MTHKNLTLVVASICLVTSFGDRQSWGSSSLNLNDAVQEAVAHSPRLAQAQASREESFWKKTEALSGFLPSVNVTAQHFFAKKYQFTDIVFGGAPASIPGIFPTSAAALNVSIPIFDGFQNVHRYKAAGLQASAAESDLQWAEFQLQKDIQLKFYQVIAAREIQAVAEQNLKTLQDHYDQVKTLKSGGVATLYDVLRVDVQLNEAKSEILNTQDNYALARQRLITAMGIEKDDREVAGSLPVPETGRLTEVSGTDMKSRPDLEALEKRFQASEQLESASGSFLIPKITLAGQYSSYNNLNDSIRDFDRYRSAYNLGLFLNWNLFDGMASIARSKESVYQKIQIEKAYEQTRIQAPTDLDFWKRRYLYSASIFAAKRSDLEKSKESVRLSTEGFRAGVRTNTEILDSELDLFRSRAGVVNAQMNCVEALIKVELSLGRNL
ncbi:MAG: TolC family protein [Methylotenera sp.]|nr:TolC family protein [Oligoflexia bacterium]